MRFLFFASPTLCAVLCIAGQQANAQTAITLAPTTLPTAGEPGVTNISLTGSNFPAGTILAASVMVSLQPSAGGKAVTTLATALTTIAGTTRRVSFTIPGSVSVAAPTAYNVSISSSTTSSVAFASSNAAVLTVNPAATLISVSPNSGQPGKNFTVVVTGSFSNFLQGSTIPSFGAGITIGSVTITNATTASVQIALASNAALGARNVTMTTGAEVASLASGFTVAPVANQPTITSFNPTSAPIGTLVTVIGTNLSPGAGTAAQVILTAQTGGSISAFANNVAATSLTFVIPAGAATGSFSISIDGASAISPSALTITAASSFSLNVLPGTANLIQGETAAYAVSLTSTSGFNQLASLTLVGLPSGVTAMFQPQQITSGQTSVLTVSAPANQKTGTSLIVAMATSSVNGLPVSQSATLTLNVQPVTTTLLGRAVVSDSLETPLAGVTVKMLGLDGNGNNTGCSGSTVSDGAGNFLLTHLPTVCVGPQLVGYDGTTVTSPAGKYAGVNLVYTLVAGQVTTPPVLIHLPRIDDQETFYVQQNAAIDQSYAFVSIPGLSVTAYAHTTFTMPDGTQPNPFPLTAVNVPVDRLPDIKPPVPTMITAFIVAFQPANATTNQPVAVYYPNPLNNAPGASMALLTLDPTHGAMVPYGTGTVSTDGTQIVPDLDPIHLGHRYGLVHFDWHMPGYNPPNQINPCPFCPSVNKGDPVDAWSGLQVINETDISFGGTRGNISIVRTYRSGFSTAATFYGPFGFGTNHNYGYELAVGTPASASVIPLIMPDGNQFSFSKQADGSFTCSANIPALAGAVMTVDSSGAVHLRWKNGTVYEFVKVFSSPNTRYLLNSITDANANTTQIVHNGFQISQIIDPVGRVMQFNYNVGGYITKITAPDGTFVSYDYKGNNNQYLRMVTHPDGSTTNYDYSLSQPGNITTITDGRGVVLASNSYDPSGSGRVVQQKQANGGVIQFSYTLQNPTAPTTSPVVATSVTDARGNSTSYRFSPVGALLSATDALGQTRVFTRDGANNITSATGTGWCSACGDPEIGDQSFAYDSFGNLLKHTDPLGNTTTFTYDPVFNKVTSIEDPLGNTSTLTYDSHGNLFTQKDANGHTTSYQYDLYGELITATDAVNKTTSFTYDQYGNATTITDPLGNTTTFQYDINGRIIQTTDALGRTTQLAYDNMNRVTKQINAQNAATSFTYDQVGNLLSVTDARGHTTSFTYDSMNGLSTRTDPLARSDSRTYDLNENLTLFKDRKGQTSSFTYDAVDRLTQETYGDGSTVTRSYDANDRLALATDSVSGSFGFTYDAAGRLTGQTTPIGAIQYTRDALGRALIRQVTGQPAVSYNYDPVGNLSGATSTPASASFAYDPRNILSTILRANGVSSNLTYDSAGRLLTISHTKGLTTLDSETYSYDAAGNRIGHSTAIAQALAAMAVASAAYDSANEEVQFGALTNLFDANGNMISASGAGGSSAFSWDARNRLKSIVTSGGQTTTFTYDFSGNLIAQTDNGSVLNLTRSYVLDDLTNTVFEAGSDGSSYTVLSGQAIDSHLAISQSNGQTLYGLTDAVNSTMATVDETGAIKSQFLYEPFGQTTASGAYFPFQYTGRTPASGNIYYNRARFYNSQAGRFISEDPLFSGNPYRYAVNNPILYGDPTGLLTLFLGVAGSTVAVQGDEISTGVYFHFGNDGVSSGFYGSSGPGAGLGIGAGVTGGFVVGSLQNFTGNFTNITGSRGPFSGTVSFNCSGQFAGISAGYGFSPLPYGISVSQTNTTIMPFSQIFNSIAGQLSTWSIQLNPSGPYN